MGTGIKEGRYSDEGSEVRGADSVGGLELSSRGFFTACELLGPGVSFLFRFVVPVFSSSLIDVVWYDIAG